MGQQLYKYYIFKDPMSEIKALLKRLQSYLTNDAPPSQLDLDEILNLNYNYIQQFSSIESIIQGLNNYEDPFSVRDSVDRRLEAFPDNPYLRMLKFATEIICKGNEDTIITNLFAAIEFATSQNFNIKQTIILSNIITIMQNLIERELLDVRLRDKIINSLIDSQEYDHNLKRFVIDQINLKFTIDLNLALIFDVYLSKHIVHNTKKINQLMK